MLPSTAPLRLPPLLGRGAVESTRMIESLLTMRIASFRLFDETNWEQVVWSQDFSFPREIYRYVHYVSS